MAPGPQLLVRGLGPLQQLAEASARALSCAGPFQQLQQRGMQELALANKGQRAGPGGRSSVSGMVTTVFGGYGFVGSYVVNEIGKRGSQVVVPYRSTENAVQHIKQMGDLGQIVLLGEFDIRDEEMVKRAISKSNVVVNMIGQRSETWNFKFDDVHVKWPERLAKLVKASPNVERFLHFSDMGANERSPSQRMRTKALGDAKVMDILPDATIVKPGPVVGVEDHFFNYIIYEVSVAPAAILPDGGVGRCQPTYVQDVAEAVMRILSRHETKGKTYHLGGPETLTQRDIYDVVMKTMRLTRDNTLHLPKNIAKLLYKPMDMVRGSLPPMPMTSWMQSADFIDEVTQDRVAPAGAHTYASLEMNPQKVTDGLALEPVRHFRVGGYRWGDMSKVAKDVPESIRRYYNLK